MNGAPDWQDGECCFRCRTQFTLVARKHHCRNCGNIFCAKCSSQQIPLPKLNIDKDVRVCDGCYEKIAGKDEQLALAIGPKEKEPTTKAEVKASTSSNNKQPAKSANASAPSEQELKEEEELQLALALSLSETPTKVSFPDCRKLEETSRIEESPKVEIKPQTTVTSTRIEASPKIDDIESVHVPISQPSNSYSDKQAVQTNVSSDIPFDRDRELYYYIAEVQSTLEIFNNRINACKLRNRPIANDSAVQSLFLKLNSDVQPKITDYIKTYEEERAFYERLQDKLSQISDARAALDDLREEHKEKLREQAAEAERLRQSQLATKLEAMRQKKTQMMQYQRELALQRIREQEMMLTQSCQTPPSQYVPGPSLTQNPKDQPQPLHQQYNQEQFSQTKPPYQQDQPSHSQQSYQHDQHLNQQQHQPYVNQWHSTNSITSQQPPVPPTTGTYPQYQPTQQPHPAAPPPQEQQQQQHPIQQSHQPQPVAPQLDYASLARLEQQYLPKPTKPDDDTPLISFDD